MTIEAEAWKHLEEIGALNPYVRRPIIRADPLLGGKPKPNWIIIDEATEIDSETWAALSSRLAR